MPKAKTETSNQSTDCLMSVPHLAASLGRPTPWIVARLEEMNAQPAMRLDSVDYFNAGWLDSLTRVSQEWTERIRTAKLEAAVAGE